MALSRKIFVLAMAFLVIAGAARAASEPRTLMSGSIKVLQAGRTRAVQPLRKEHLGKEMEIQIALRMRSFPKLLARIANGERVPQDQLAALYLPLPADYQAVIDWAKAQGLTITLTDPMRLAVFVKGTVAQIQTATQAQFAEVTIPEGTFTSAITAPSLPASLAARVLGVNGLQPEIHPRHMAS